MSTGLATRYGCVISTLALIVIPILLRVKICLLTQAFLFVLDSHSVSINLALLYFLVCSLPNGFASRRRRFVV